MEFTNQYGREDTVCAFEGCQQPIAKSGDTAYCEAHSDRCAYCGCFIDKGRKYCTRMYPWRDKVKYVNQLLYEHIPYPTRTDTPEDEGGKHTTVKSSGCGLASAVMTVDRLLGDRHFEIEDAVRLAIETKSNHVRGTDYKIYAFEVAKKFGLHVESRRNIEYLKQSLKNGCVAIVLCVQPSDGSYISLFTKRAHYFTVIGMSEDGRAIVLDPSQTPDKYESEGRKGKAEVLDGHFVLCGFDVIARENAAIYIFSKSEE